MAIPRSFSGNQFLFRIDDDDGAPGLLKSVSGGGITGKLIDEGPGSDLRRIKHVGVVELQKFDLELSLAQSGPFLRWIRESWQRDFARRNGVIVHADFDYCERQTQSFQDALITETKFPALAGDSKAPAYLTVSIQPEESEIKKGDGNRIRGVHQAGEKKWLTSNFRLSVSGIDCTSVSKIDAFSVKQNVKPVYTGENRFPELEPTGLEFGDLTVYTALEHADDFIAWHREYVLKGGTENRFEREGSIEFLAPDCEEVLLTIELKNVGIRGLTIDASKAGQSEIKRAKIDLYVEAMDLAI